MDFKLNSIFRIFILVLISGINSNTAGQTTCQMRKDPKADSLVHDYLRNGYFVKALQQANLYRMNALSDNCKNAAWLLRTSEIYFRQGNMNAGNVKLAEAREFISRLNDPGHLLRFRLAFQEGRYFYFMNKATEALQCFHRAETYASYLRDQVPLEISSLYEELGNVSYKLYEFEASVRYYRLAIRVHPVDHLIDFHEITVLEAKLAHSLWYMNERTKAEVLFRKCVEYLDTTESPFHPSLFEAYIILNNYAYDFYPQFPVTEDFLRKAGLILDRFYPANHYLTGILFTEKARNEFAVNDYDNALYYSKRALQVFSAYQFMDRQVVTNYQLMACVYYYFEHDYKKTVTLCNQAIAGLQDAGPSPAYLYYMAGISYQQLNDESRAIENLTRVIRLTSGSSHFKDDDLCARAHYALGKLYLLKNEADISRQYLQQSIKYAKRTSDKGYEISAIYLDLGLYYIHQGNYQRALIYLQKSIIAGCNTFHDTSVYAVPAMADVVLIRNVISCLAYKAYALYAIYRNKEQSDLLFRALECQELSVKLTEKRLFDIDEEKSGLSFASLRRLTMNNAVSYAVLLYLKTHEGLYLEKAWEYAEKSRMQILSINSMKRNNLVYAGLPDSLVNKEESLNREILEIENLMARGDKQEYMNKGDQEPLARLTGLYDRRDELKAFFEENYPAYKRFKYNFTVAGIDQVQQQLDEDQVIIEYQLLSTEIITFIITKRDCRIHYQLTDTSVASHIIRLRKAITTNPVESDPLVTYQEFIESSYYLYTKLIKPVYASIRNKRLIIIPHSELTQIPFEVLIQMKPDDTTRIDYKSLGFLIREFPIAYAFSASLLIDRDAGWHYGSGTAIFLPEYSSDNGKDVEAGISSLEGAVFEASEVRKLTGGKLFKNIKADEAAFKAYAPKFRLLHITSHTVLDETNPHLSCMIMSEPDDSSEDGKLYSYEIMQLDLHAQLVVLSGCNTGYGLLQPSEGLISLARSFFYTGVRTVAFTLWHVADRASTDLMRLFYQGLRHRLSLDRALRTAKLSFLDHADAVRAHPFYWAGYIVVGRTESVALFRSNIWIIIIASILFALLITGFLIRKNTT